jgi:hypothetical protein
MKPEQASHLLLGQDEKGAMKLMLQKKGLIDREIILDDEGMLNILNKLFDIKGEQILYNWIYQLKMETNDGTSEYDDEDLLEEEEYE